MSSDALADALTALAQFQAPDSTLGDTLHRIAEITAEALPAASFVGMTMLDDDAKPTTAIFTSHESPEIDAAQYRDGKGPCLDAWRTQRVIRLDEVQHWTGRYPRFCWACQRHGVRSTLSLPLVSGDVAHGSLNLYAAGPNLFTPDDETLGLTLARVAGSALARHQGAVPAVATDSANNSNSSSSGG